MSNECSSWDLIEQNEFELACKKAEEEYIDTKSEFHLRNKNIALLNLKKYNEVLETAKEIIEITNGKSDSDYIVAGISSWLVGDKREAIQIWKDGLNAPYTDAAGGVEVPLLLYFASVILSNESLEKEATNLLKKKYKSRKSTNFPGAIAGYVLGRINEEEMLDICSEMLALKNRAMCKAYFYIAAKNLKCGNKIQYFENLQKCVKHKNYLEEEYFLAVEELERSNK